MPPLEAALKGAEQIGFTILSLTVSLIAVLIPLLFMGDIVGRLFREFAITLAVTILISAVVSLTLTPMMCARLLKHKPESEQGALYRLSERVFAGHHRVLRADAAGGSAASADHAAGGGRHAGGDHLSVLDYPQRIFPGAGYRRDSGRFGSAADHFVPGHGASASRRWPR